MDVITPKNRTRVVLDATTLNAYLVCEEFLNLRHNHNLVPLSGPGDNLEKGLMMHHILETYYLAKREHLNRETANQLAMATGMLYTTGCEQCIKNECLIHKNNPYKGLQSIKIDDAHYVIHTFQQYEEFWKNDSWRTLDVEYVVGAVIYEDDEISLLWKAKCDWLVETDEAFGVSVDHKTASRREDVNSLDNQFIGQCVVTKQTKMFRNVIGFQSSLKPNEKFTREAVNYTKDRMAEWILEMASYAYDIVALQESGRYRHKFTSCKRKYGDCIFRRICEGNPSDRQRLIEAQFRIADRVWDISND